MTQSKNEILHSNNDDNRSEKNLEMDLQNALEIFNLAQRIDVRRPTYISPDTCLVYASKIF